jgi:hypothetical protein
MPSNLISPLLWQSVPFKDNDAWLDFMGQHDRWHQAFAIKLKIAWFPMDDLREELSAHQRLHDATADSLGIPRAGDLTSYDLKNDRDSYTSWHFLHSNDHQRFRLAAGL